MKVWDLPVVQTLDDRHKQQWTAFSLAHIPKQGSVKEVGKLANALVIDPKTLDAEGRVVFGATVDLEDVEAGKPVSYQIVGDDEADLKAGMISVNSPIARALIGKYAGDMAEVQAPGGVREYEIVDVRYV